MQGEESTAEEIPRAVTMPSNLQFSARGFADEEYAKEAIYKLHTVLSVISQSIDLTKLDGVTIAFDYDQALAELDRGYETAYKLTASKGIAIGVAMAPRVIREGVVKTHLVLNANYALSILEKPGEESDYFFQSLHLIAHECAHVEVTAAFDECFPGFLLQKAHSNILDNMRWQVILAAWDEYAVCRIAGSIGYDPAGGYLETLVKVLSDTRVQCYEIIKAYRIHGDVGQVATEVYGKLGDLLKYSSYFLGAIAAQDAPEERPAALVEGSEFDWFSPFYDRLIEAHGVLWGAFGKWERLDAFEAVGDILQDMADSVGVEATRQPDDPIYFDIPLRRESMPDSDLSDPVMRALFDIDALVK